MLLISIRYEVDVLDAVHVELLLDVILTPCVLLLLASG
jgi:hypothetical protein